MLYYRYFVSEYTNKVDNFKLEIFGNKSTFVEENISATAVLSYKDVDNILEPIRGAQLDIDIDANIAKPYNLFLDFREKDFKVKFYRNDDLIFEGFVNPEGVAQDYNSINWRAKLVAVDNLGALKNTEHPYTNELPSEFVFMDLALKQTGITLPIAFFDDINQNVRINNITIPYDKKLQDGINERLIEPSVFKNDNDRFIDCETVLLDILQKYNAIIFQSPVKHLNTDTGQEESMLCWVFCRVPTMNRPINNFNSPFQFKEITTYVNVGDFLSPVIFQYNNLKFGIPFNIIGTDGEGTQFQPLNAFHKNKNQLIRQTRATKAFRFVHEFIEKPNIFDFFGFDLFTFIGALSNLFYNTSNLSFAYWVGISDLATWDNSFDPEGNINADPSDAFVEVPALDIPIQGVNLQITGAGRIFEFGGSLVSNVYIAMHFQALHIAPSGKRYWLVSPPLTDGAYLINQFFVANQSTFQQSSWIEDVDIQQDSLGNLDIRNISNLLFGYFGQNLPSDNTFELNLPTLAEGGGTVQLYFSPLYVRNPSLDLITTPVSAIRYAMTDLKLRVLQPSELGKGNYYDAENEQDVSSKIEEPINIINADDKTNIFLNGLKNDFNSPKNYDYWTSFWNLNPDKTDILELTSIERIRLFSKSQNIFSGDIHGYVPYFTRMVNKAYPANVNFVFTKWRYDTVNNTIESEMMECKVLDPSVDFEKSVIFEDEDKKLID